MVSLEVEELARAINQLHLALVDVSNYRMHLAFAIETLRSLIRKDVLSVESAHYILRYYCLAAQNANLPEDVKRTLTMLQEKVYEFHSGKEKALEVLSDIIKMLEQS